MSALTASRTRPAPPPSHQQAAVPFSVRNTGSDSLIIGRITFLIDTIGRPNHNSHPAGTPQQPAFAGVSGTATLHYLKAGAGGAAPGIDPLWGAFPNASSAAKWSPRGSADFAVRWLSLRLCSSTFASSSLRAGELLRREHPWCRVDEWLRRWRHARPSRAGWVPSHHLQAHAGRHRRAPSLRANRRARQHPGRPAPRRGLQTICPGNLGVRV